MLGTIVNVIAIVAGSLLGGLFRKMMDDKLSASLIRVMGLAAFGLGINAVVQNMPKSTYPILFIVSLAVGCLIGELLQLNERLTSFATRNKDNNSLGQGIVTGCLIFCVGTLSILGPVQSALYNDHTYLFTNASLDFVTAMVLSTTYGVGMALAGVVLLLWQGSIYLLTLWLGNFITGTMMVEISIVGGFLIAMSGLSIMKAADFEALNCLPALLVPILWCMFAG
ncbi:MAG: DUF554 domain-containing protein [Selenomonas sp.]|uniref:DUF554 domain-containing protein n=1 Tax=Selenomonas sp. TaxID=2053611 RepID=UPI0025EE2FA8|nr:DUF554 domain-containing protein [Selenomonas sp.]MCR5756525.1 DUF554 domain-containing protein [Selenomonas sp.]